jgi:hypothetical protein
MGTIEGRLAGFCCFLMCNTDRGSKIHDNSVCSLFVLRAYVTLLVLNDAFGPCATDDSAPQVPQSCIVQALLVLHLQRRSISQGLGTTTEATNVPLQRRHYSLGDHQSTTCLVDKR